MPDLARLQLQPMEPEPTPERPLRDPREPGILDPVARRVFEIGRHSHRDIVAGTEGAPALVWETEPS